MELPQTFRNVKGVGALLPAYYSFFHMKLVTQIFISTFSLMSLAYSEKPNVVYIIADDLGYSDLSCYGQKGFETPHLDQMAKDGIRFTSHYSGSTVCAPSRSCLMTGQDSGNTYIRGNGKYQLREEDLTVAELFQDAGYKTGMVGKSCVTGNTSDAQAPHVSGFDYFWGTLSHKIAHYHYPSQVYSQGEVVKIEGNNGQTGSVYIQDEYTKRSLEFIDDSKDAPFFLLLSYSVPHASLQAPKEAVEPFIGKFPNERSFKGGHYTACEHVLATHAAMVTRMDQHVGEIVGKLKELGIDENTIICFTSDNGSHVEGGYNYKLLKSNGELRGGKRDLYEGGIRVPMIVKWPKVVKAGRETNHASAFWDFLPTVCETVGVKPPEGIQGVSYLPLLKGEKQPSHDFLYWEYQNRMALRKGEWKLVKHGVGAKVKKNKKVQKVGYELFNLSDDLGEKNDLATKHPEKVKELSKLLKSARTPSPEAVWNF